MTLSSASSRRNVSCWKMLCALSVLFLCSASAFAQVRPLAWGRGGNGQLGRGSTSPSSLPISVTTSGALAGKTITALSGGFNHSLALSSEGKVYAWGWNSYGQLGDWSYTNRTSPVAVTQRDALAGKTVTAIAAGSEHSLALTSDGGLYTWGLNSSGQLGTNTTIPYSSEPVPVWMSGALAGKSIRAIAASNHHSLVLASDGTVYGWGNNSSGELGNGSTTAQRAPVPVTTVGTPMEGKVVTAIACGSNFSLALTSDGGLYSWGSNAAGQLGIGNYTSSALPKAVIQSGVLAGKSISAISCGASFALVVSSEGLIYGWGENYFGQIGTGVTGYNASPVATKTSGVLAGKSIRAISTGVNYSLALDTSGQLYSFGDGNEGKLGTGSTAQIVEPTKVASCLSAATLFSAGGHHALALGEFRSLPPVANSASVTAAASQSTPIYLSGSDPEGDSLTYSIVSGPTQGTLSGSGSSVTYAAPATFTSADSFTFKVNDGTSDSAPATVTINPGEAPSLVVTTTSNTWSNTDFKTSLREAIEYATRRDGPDIITFNIPTSDSRFLDGVFTINLLNALPYITGGTTIDGDSQTAFTGNTNPSGPEVVLQGGSDSNGSLSAHGLIVSGGSCVIKGLGISGFRNSQTAGAISQQYAGVLLNGSASGARVVGCYIGTDATGTRAQANGYGVLVMGASNVVIGDQGATGRNVISGNLSDGVRVVDCLNTAVRNCYVGTNASGTAALGNFKGIALEATARNSIIGGQGVGNVISGNRYNGLGIQGSGHVVRGNFIGTNAEGTAALGNASGGVVLHNNAQSNTIGGTDAGARNVISGNGEGGIYINYHTTVNNVVQGNFIGTNAQGTGAIGNQGRGIYMDAGTSSNTIGGSAAGANRIAFNTGDGISLLSDGLGDTVKNNLRGNQIYSNGGLGINLSIPGTNPITLNDDGDGDSGANNFQNFPVLTSAVNASRGLTVKGSLNSTPSTSASRSFFLDFYASAAADPSGYGEGQTLISSQSVATDASGNASFTFVLPSVAPGQVITATATDAEGNTSEFSQARVVVANTAPVASAQSVTTAEEESGVITLGATDAEGDPLVYSSVAAPEHGALIGTGASLTYTPRANFNGSDSFSFKVNDGTVDSNTATITINVTPVNDRPVAVADAYSTSEDVALTVEARGVLTNDSDIDGDALSAVLESGVAHGSLALNANGSFSYTPERDFSGTDRFTYKASDGTAESNIATVSITVSAVDDAPVAVGDAYSTSEDTALTVEARGVLANDTDVEGDALNAVLESDVAHGSLTLNANGSFVYTPARDFNGTDRFTYKASHGQASSEVATVVLTVRAVNDAPVAREDTYATNEGAALAIEARGVLVNDEDVDGDALSALLTSDVAHGSLTLAADGAFTYTPAQDFSGTDRFTYKANDGKLDSASVTVVITVAPVNDAPSFTPGANQTATEDAGTQTAPGWATSISAGPADEADQTLTFLVSHNNNALFSVAPSIDATTGNLTYTLAPNAHGTATVRVQLKDNGGQANGGADISAEQSFTITVSPVNDAPVAQDDSYKVAAGATLTVPAPGVLANDRDVEGSPLTATLGSMPANGSVTLSANGSFTYKPRGRFTGTDRFTYTVSDGTATSNVATVAIAVGGTDTPSTVTLSSASASARQDTVTLSFTGALSPTSAADKAIYQVQVTPAGSTTPRLYTIATASYSISTFTVTLALNEDLQRNDQIVVSWTSLLDSRGNTMTGKSPVLSAK